MEVSDTDLTTGVTVDMAMDGIVGTDGIDLAGEVTDTDGTIGATVDTEGVVTDMVMPGALLTVMVMLLKDIMEIEAMHITQVDVVTITETRWREVILELLL